MAKTQFLIGIDLGTTNCTMAYSPLSDEGEIIQFPILQITSAGAETESYSLPSFLYLPLQEEIKAKAVGLSWNPDRDFCVGSYAHSRGAELSSRLISSAKSWLCHTGVDRRSALLPLLSDETSIKKSPLETCAEFLRHLKEVWDHKMPKAPLRHQSVLITVPASFDPSARQLVLEAAQMAGYPEVVLIEEPQAAFYAWLHHHTSDWRKLLKVGDTILVVDIGGGTTDFSLIQVADSAGDLTLERLAVGEHLLLGGDNIDLSLAYLARSKFEEQNHFIDDWQLQSLIHTCRKAKEAFLSDSPPKHFDVTVMGRGSKLIGGTIKTKITLEEAKTVLIDGFAPLVNPEEKSSSENRSGLQQIGLPYAQDARFTAQLAKFLSANGAADFIVPSVVLFNGGTMKAEALRQRLVDQLNAWAKKFDRPSVKVLPDADYDFAVSKGAVYYGKARQGNAIRIKSGTSHSYFIGVEDALPAVPGVPPSLKAICIVPFGMEEGSEVTLENQEFALVLGRQATFRFFSLSGQAAVGDSTRRWKQDLKELHPIEAVLDQGDVEGKTVRVKIHSKVTELGVLEVWCESDDGRKWKLEFDIRLDSSTMPV